MISLEKRTKHNTENNREEKKKKFCQSMRYEKHKTTMVYIALIDPIW